MLALPLLVRPLEIFDAAVVKDPKPRRNFVDQIVIVRDQQDWHTPSLRCRGPLDFGVTAT